MFYFAELLTIKTKKMNTKENLQSDAYPKYYTKNGYYLKCLSPTKLVGCLITNNSSEITQCILTEDYYRSEGYSLTNETAFNNELNKVKSRLNQLIEL